MTIKELIAKLNRCPKKPDGRHAFSGYTLGTPCGCGCGLTIGEFISTQRQLIAMLQAGKTVQDELLEEIDSDIRRGMLLGVGVRDGE